MTRNLTEGRIMPLLIKFAIPLVLGNIFQLTYNAVDSIIVGRFVGPGALAAVGSCNPLTTLVILILNGLCIGAGVLMGNEYGAGRIERLERQISTTAIAGTAFSAVLTAAFIIFARQILGIMQVDDAIMDMAVRYMRIIFVGLIFTFLYNFLSSTLRALGDSMTPLFFLIGSSLLNILGDILFVVVFGMGSEGCAISTVISEALCCLGCVIYIKMRIPILVLGRKWLVFDRSLIGPTVSYGWASAMQQGTVQLGKIGIQAIVNSIGVFVAAAFTAVNRLDDFTYMPQQNIAHAITAFMAQNHGAEREDRVLEGFKKGMILEVIYAGIVCFVSFVFARPLMRLFGDDPEVIAHGVRYLRLIAFMYIMPAFTNGIQGYFRGVGRLKLTLAASMINMGTRVGTAAVLVIGLGLGIEALPWSYFAGWVGMLCLQVPVLTRELKKRSSARSS